MAFRDSGLNCFNCGHFNVERFRHNRRGCKIHDFVFPDVDVEIICSDFSPTGMTSDKGLQLVARVGSPTALWYHMFPYVAKVHKFAEFAALQKIFFGSELVSALDIAAQKELIGIAVDVTKAYGLWEKTGKQSAVQLLLDGREFEADIMLVDYRYQTGAIQKLILYSNGAQNSLQNIFGTSGDSKDGMPATATPKINSMPVLGFVGISDDFSCVSFSRNEVAADL